MRQIAWKILLENKLCSGVGLWEALTSPALGSWGLRLAQGVWKYGPSSAAGSLWKEGDGSVANYQLYKLYLAIINYQLATHCPKLF